MRIVKPPSTFHLPLFTAIAMCIAFVIKPCDANAQNLIPNPGFEEYNECPEGLNPFPLKNWNSPTRGNPDYYHTCSVEGDKGFSVPDNNYGKQSPKSGNGYVGLTMHSDFPTIVEYIQVDLDKKLVAEEIYHISVFVSLADNSESALGDFAVRFSEGSYVSNKWERLLPSKHSIDLRTSAIDDSESWIQLQGFYKAKGGEATMIFGNFAPHNSKTRKSTGYEGKGDAISYYYVDQMSLTESFSFTMQGGDQQH